jgi:hypothetical protein
MKAITENNRIGNVALHLLVWGILFGFPFFFTIGEAPRSYVYFRSMMPLLFSMLIFYVNYFVLIERVLFKDQVLLFIIINFGLIALSLWGLDLARDLLPNPLANRNINRPSRPRNFNYRTFSLIRTGFSFLLTAGVSVGVRAMQRWLRAERARKAAETEHLKSTLTHLQYQIQPHFFFNSLNNIYSLVDIAPEKAKDAIHRMGKLMRYLLYNANAEQVPLADEIRFLRNYIQLMQLRLTEKVNVTYNFPDDTSEIQIAPLLFIPLVENSFKHGVSANQPSFIAIRMCVKDRRLVFESQNTNFPKDERDKGGSGIGIENLKKRLKLQYPDRHKLRQTVEEDIFKTKLEINLANDDS